MNKQYSEPSMVVVELSEQDVVRTSDADNTQNPNGTGSVVGEA